MIEKDWNHQLSYENDIAYFAGLHVQKTYTSLGTSCDNAYTKFFCWLLMHFDCN